MCTAPSNFFVSLLVGNWGEAMKPCQKKQDSNARLNEILQFGALQLFVVWQEYKIVKLDIFGIY